MPPKKMCKVTSEDSAELAEAYGKLAGIYARMSNTQSVKRSSQAQRDPNRPKRPMTAYHLFLQDKFKELKEEDPSSLPTDIVTKIGLAWRELDENRRSGYTAQAEVLQAKYRDVIAQYNSGQGAEASDEVPSGSAQPAAAAAAVAASKAEPRAKKASKAVSVPAAAGEPAPNAKDEKLSRKGATAESSDASALPKKKKNKKSKESAE